MKLTIQTNANGKLEVFDESGKKLDNLGKIEIFITSANRVSAFIEFKDVQVKLKVSS